MPNFTNNAVGYLLGSITASSTSITLQSGQGALFPASGFVITLVQKTSGVIDKQEIAYCVSRSGDVLTVTRAYENCPTSPSSNTQESTAQSFAAYVDENNGTVVSVRVTANFLNQIQTDIGNRLTLGGLRTGLANAWRLFFSNGSKNETELTLGASGTFLKSNGPSATPIRDNPPLDIASQTTSTVPTTSWFVALYSGASNFKVTLANLVKGLATATTTQAGVVERATDTEATARTDTTRYVTPKHLGDLYTVIDNNYGVSAIAGTTYTAGSSPTERTYTEAGTYSYTKLKEIVINVGGTYTCSVEAKFDGNEYTSGTVGYIAFYKNGSLLSESQFSQSSTYSTRTYNMTVNSSDLIQIYGKSTYPGKTVYAKNLLVQYDMQEKRSNLITSTVNL